MPTFPVCTRPEKSLHRKGGEGGGDGSLVGGKTYSTTSAGGGRSSSSFSDCGSPGSGITVDEEGKGEISFRNSFLLRVFRLILSSPVANRILFRWVHVYANILMHAYIHTYISACVPTYIYMYLSQSV